MFSACVQQGIQKPPSTRERFRVVAARRFCRGPGFGQLQLTVFWETDRVQVASALGARKVGSVTRPSLSAHRPSTFVAQDPSWSSPLLCAWAHAAISCAYGRLWQQRCWTGTLVPCAARHVGEHHPIHPPRREKTPQRPNGISHSSRSNSPSESAN